MSVAGDLKMFGRIGAMMRTLRAVYSRPGQGVQAGAGVTSGRCQDHVKKALCSVKMV